MSLESELFKLINKKEFSAALTILKQNANLDINALNEEGGSFFMEAVMKKAPNSPERYAFIEALLSNPKFQHANTPYEDATATPSIFALTGHDPVLAALIVKYKDSKSMDVINYKKKLMYEEISQTASNCKISDFLPDYKKVQAIVLHATVHHAIKTDDSTLLQRLEDAGADLTKPLNDGVSLSVRIHHKTESNVYRWYQEHHPEQFASSSQETQTDEDYIQGLKGHIASSQQYQQKVSELHGSLYKKTTERRMRVIDSLLQEIEEDKKAQKNTSNQDSKGYGSK